MKIFALLTTGILALGLGAGGTSADDAASQGDILHVMSSIADVGSAISEIGQIDNVSDVRLVRLDDLDMGESEHLFLGALALQRGTAEVHALRAAVAGNPQLIAELRKQNINFRSIVAIDIGRFGTITVYTFGASS